MVQVAKMFGFLSPKQQAETRSHGIDGQSAQELDPAKLASFYKMIHEIPTSAAKVDAWNEDCAALIDEMVVSRVSSSEMASILAGLISYQKTGVTPSHSHHAFIEAFRKSSGLFQEVLHYSLFPRANGRGDGPIGSPHFGSIDAQARAAILEEVRRTGYCVLPFKLRPETIDQLCRTAEGLSFVTKERESEDVPAKLQGIDPRNPPRCGGAYAESGQLTATPVFRDLANDPLIIALASEYLETPVVPINAVLWYSFAAASASSELAQLFHYDLDTLRWLKVFFYLNDVTDANGPHEYVEGSHKSGAKSQELLDRGYERISDDDIARAQRGSVRSVEGEAGTVVLGDTRAFHKGRQVTSGYRLLYQPIYAASKIGYVHAK